MPNEQRIFSSYRGLFRIKYAIHRVGEYALPVEIPLDTLLIFLALLFPVYPAGWLLSLYLYPGHPWVVNFILVAAASYYASKADPQGKSLPEFAAGLAAYLFRPKKATLAGELVRVKPEGWRGEKMEWAAWEISRGKAPEG